MKAPLRSIAVFSPYLPREGRKRGGVDRVAHDLADGLARRGHRVVVWSHDPQPPRAAYSVRPLPWGEFCDTWLGLRLTSGYLNNFLAVLPRYGDVEVIIAHGDSLLLPFRGRPLIRVMHGSARAEARTATSALRYVAQSGVFVQELLTGLTQRGCVGVSENTLRDNPFVKRVIPNGVDLSIFSGDGAGKSAEPSIAFVGTLTGRKRGALLMEWFAAQVRPRHPTARLWMVGPPGPPAEGVEYFSGISPADLAQLYRRAWVYASPSSYEGFGLPYVEAMASGTPVVATPNPGSREVTAEGRFGLLVEDAEFAVTVTRLLGDAEERRRWIELGRTRAQEFSLDRMLDRYEQLMNELCGPSRTG